MVIKALLLVIIELIVYWIIGTLVSGVIERGRKTNLGVQIVGGFLCYQILFQICALPFIMLRRSLTELTGFWNIVLVVILVVGFWAEKKEILTKIKEVMINVKRQPFIYIAAVFGIGFVCYYTITNGRLDLDSVYYIGLVNTTLESDMLFRRNVYTGELVPSLYLRRVLVTFEINSAVLAKTFEIHPIILMRVTRGSLNVLLTFFSLKEIGNFVYKKYEKKEKIRKSITFTLIALYSNFFMDNTIYTNATFFLTRAYEGKAYAANTLILFLIFLCLEVFLTGKKENCWWILFVLWASVAISTSALAVCGVALAVWIVAYYFTKILCKKKGLAED